MNARWRPKERLRHKKKFDELFRRGKSFGMGPMRLFYRLYPATASYPRVAAGFAVPKKKIKKAVHRNLIKRRMREAFRIQKSAIYSVLPQSAAVDLVLLYRDTKVADYSAIHAAIAKGIAKMSEALGFDSPPPSTV